MTDKRLLSLKIILVYLAFQNIVSILLSNINVAYGKAAILLKDFLLYFAVLFYMFYSSISKSAAKPRLISKGNSFDLIIYSYTVILFIYFLIPLGSQSYFIKAISFRQLLIMPILYVIGKLFRGLEVEKINKFIVHLGFFICVFAVIEMAALGDNFWKSIGIYNYMKAKGFELWANAEGISKNFYTWDYLPLIKGGYGHIRRMVGLHADPLLTAQFLAYPALLLFFRFNLLIRPLGSLGALFFLTVIALTFSKGAILLIIISVITMGIFKFKIISRIKSIWFVVALLGPIGIAAFLARYDIYSVSSHLTGLMFNLNNLLSRPFGFGLGIIGNYPSVLSSRESSSDLGGGESYLGTMIGQLGIFAVIYFLLLVFIVYRKAEKETGVNYKIILITIFAVLCTASLSEAAITYTGTGYLFLFLGAISDDINSKNG